MHVKVSLRLEHPIQWLGSALATLFKGKGSSSLIAHYREVHIAQHDGKIFDANTGTQLIDPLAAIKLSQAIECTWNQPPNIPDFVSFNLIN